MRFRWVATAAAAIGCTGAIAAAIVVFGYSHDHASTPPAAQVTAGTTSPSQSNPSSTGRSNTGPPVGLSGPMTVSAHCGIRYADFAGKTWETTPLPTPDPVPDSNGLMHSVNVVNGQATVTAPGVLTFVVIDPTVTINAQTIIFHNTTATPPSCM